MKKKFITMTLLAALILSAFAGCGDSNDNPNTPSTSSGEPETTESPYKYIGKLEDRNSGGNK